MKKHTKQAWRSIYPLVRPHLGAIIAMNILTVLQSVAQIALAMVTKIVIDGALSGSESFLYWVVALGAVLLSIVLLDAALRWCSGSTTDKCIARMRQALLAAAESSEETRLQQFHSGQLLSRSMEDVRTVCDGFVLTLPSVLGQITRLIGAFCAILILYPAMGPLLLLACVLVVGSTALLRPIMRRQHRLVRSADEQVMSGLQENLQQLELVQSLQMENTSQKRFAGWIKNSLAARYKRRLWSVGIGTYLSTVSQLGTGALLVWCALQVAHKAMTYGALTAMLQLLAMLRSPVLGLSGIWTRLSAVEVAAERLCDLLNAPKASVSCEPATRVDAIVFENVTFHYPGDETPVLENLNLRLPLNGWTCLTGISGKGKSTMFKLILGLYAPQQGRVYLETDRGQLDCSKQTRHLFAYVPQDYSLFSGTVTENLLLAAPDADDAQRRQALHAAQADFVFTLTAGEETLLKENTGLSKGQLQRLAIARAILMDRPVLLLDECTSALDAQTETALLQALAKLNKQALIVTHRPDALLDHNATMIAMDN